MSLTAALLGTVERCDDLGVRTVPVKGKVAILPWKKPPETADVIRVVESDPDCTGLAALLSCGNDLICRDWDDPDAMDAWCRANPELARTLPMDRSARAGHAYARASGVRTIVLPDGELRGRGSYTVMAPSLTVDPPPGAPKQYIWLRPFPAQLDQIPTVDPGVFCPPGMAPEHARTDAGEDAAQPAPETPKYHGLGGLGGITITECIFRTLPKGPGERHHRLWDLARWLRAILPPDTSEATLRGIAADWFGYAKHVVRTRDVRVTQNRLVEAWYDVEMPAGCSWQSIVEIAGADDWKPRTGIGSADRIARLFRAAGHAHGGQPFRLEYERMAKAVGVTKPSAYAAAQRVVGMGLAEIVEPGSPVRKDHKATVWRWAGP